MRIVATCLCFLTKVTARLCSHSDTVEWGRNNWFVYSLRSNAPYDICLTALYWLWGELCVILISPHKNCCIESKAYTALMIEIVVLWLMTWCSVVGDSQHIEGTCWVRLVCLDMVQLRSTFLQLFNMSVWVLERNLSSYDPATSVLLTKEHAVPEKD